MIPYSYREVLLKKAPKRFSSFWLMLSIFIISGIFHQSHAQTSVEIIGADTVCIPATGPIIYRPQVTGATGAILYSWSFSFWPIPINDSVLVLNRYTPGSWEIILTAYDSTTNALLGSDTINIIFLTCGTPPPGIGELGAHCTGSSSQFYSLSSGYNNSNYTVLWDMGDGTNYTTDLRTSVFHQYSQTGSYLVKHCIANSVNGDTLCTIDTVQVNSTCPSETYGYLYIDNNVDNLFDSLDTPLAGYPITIDIPSSQLPTNAGPIVVYTDSNGYYSARIGSGAFDFRMPALPGLAFSSPSSGYRRIAFSQGSLPTQFDYGYVNVSNANDLAVSLVSSPTRPGFTHRLYAHYSNLGSMPASGTITVSYDPKAIFQSAQPTATHDPINHTVTWTFSNLPPAALREQAYADFLLPASTPLNSLLFSTAQITPITGDDAPSNNTYSFTSTVVGSFDPNDKQVDQPQVIQGTEALGYTIRFQNTGTDTAFNIVVRDTLDADLDLSTFEMLGASHPYELIINGDREVVWTFSNILLPDSGANEALSHGHITYRIKPNNSLVPGTAIENTAGIYFDFNSPIVTNTTLNTIAFPFFFGENEGEELNGEIPGLRMFPNPASREVTVSFNNDDQLTHQAQLVGVDGKVFCKKETTGNSMLFDLHELARGIYFIHINNPNGLHTSQKLIVN